MSRGVRDLRELICVSRLNVVNSDEYSESESSNTSSGDKYDLYEHNKAVITRSNSAENFHDNLVSPSYKSLQCRRTKKKLTHKYNHQFVHSYGVIPGIENGTQKLAQRETFIESAKIGENAKDICVDDSLRELCLVQKSKSTHENGYDLSDDCDSPELEFTSESPSRSWLDKEFECQQNLTRTSENKKTPKCSITTTLYNSACAPTQYMDCNYDSLLKDVEPQVISAWLEWASERVRVLDEWCHTDDNFVQLAHIWLSNITEGEKTRVITIEYDRLLKELSLGFSHALTTGTIKEEDICAFLGAVFREFPLRLLGASGAYLFLDYLDVLSSDKCDSFRMLLSDVKCWTDVSQYAQWILAIRSFALLTVWTAVVEFIKTGMSHEVGDYSCSRSGTFSSRSGTRSRSGRISSMSSRPNTVSGSGRDTRRMSVNSVNEQRIFQAIRCDYLEVVQYFLQTGKVSPKCCDNQDRSLIFVSIVSGRPRVLHFLVTQMSPVIDVNSIAESGNSALHAAANMGSSTLVDELLRARDINVNVQNRACDNATPLHLAVMHGHAEIVRMLLSANADPTLMMGERTAIELARDFDQDDILDILNNHST